MSAQDKPKRDQDKTLLPYDWQSRRPTQDTDAACETVLRDRGRTR